MQSDRALEEAKTKRYLSVRWRNSSDIERRYYDWCKANNLPYLKVYRGNKFCDVSIDLSTTADNLSLEGQKAMAALCRKYAEKQSSISHSSEYCSVDRISEENVGDLINELIPIYDIYKAKVGE